jgi:uncharacterized membrane protein YhdT
MLTRLLHSRLTAGVPIVLVGILALIQFVFQVSFVECSRGKGCERANIAGLFQLDTKLNVNADGSLKRSPAPVPQQASDEARTKIEAKNETEYRKHLGAAVRRHTARFVWSFFVGVGLLVSIAGWIAAALLLTRTPGERGRPYWLRLACVFVPSLTVAGFLYLNPKILMNLMMDVFEATIANRKGELWDLNAPWVMQTVNAFDIGTSLALVLACSVMLLPPRLATAGGAGEIPPTDAKEQLRLRLLPVTHRLRYLRIVLYVATLLLVVGVLRMQSVMEWVLSFVKPEDAAILSGLTGVASSVTGAFYSLVLAAIYLPSAYILRARAEGMIAEVAAPLEVKKEIRESAVLSHSLESVVPRIAALLGPLLAGPFANLLTRL